MTSYKPIDVSKEDFRKYLERTGFLEAMTKILLKCNSARPDDAIEFVKENLGERKQDSEEVTNLKAELQSARAEIERLTMEINLLKGGTASDERSSSDLELDTTEENETAPQNRATAKANGEETESPALEAEVTAVTASVASRAITEQGKEDATKAVDAPATEVQNGPAIEKPDEKEKEGEQQ